MLATLRTAALLGVDACAVQVEVDVSFGMPMFTMVGLPDASVRESRDRVRSAIRNSGFEFPPHRITVNLAPADVRKAGAAFDLPIALGVLAAQGVIATSATGDAVVVGELSLDGTIQPTRGVLPVAAAARRDGIRRLLLPAANAAEAAVVLPGGVIPVSTLADAVSAMNGGGPPPRIVVPPPPPPPEYPDFADVCGQLLPRRAIEIAAAGAHNLLLVGPPGAGKTMMARRMAGVLPPLTFEEALEVDGGSLGRRPAAARFRAHGPEAVPRAASHRVHGGARRRRLAATAGGSEPCAQRRALPRRDARIQRGAPSKPCASRWRKASSASRERPARRPSPRGSSSSAAMNPCPCGFAGDSVRDCRCTPQQVAHYVGRLSGPLRDRLDLTVEVRRLPPELLGASGSAEASAAMRGRVVAARERQHQRGGSNGGSINGRLSASQLKQHCPLDRASLRLLRSAAERLGLSARGFDRVRRVARTIADLAGAEQIADGHVAEALQFRAPG